MPGTWRRRRRSEPGRRADCRCPGFANEERGAGSPFLRTTRLTRRRDSAAQRKVRLAAEF